MEKPTFVKPPRQPMHMHSPAPLTIVAKEVPETPKRTLPTFDLSAILRFIGKNFWIGFAAIMLLIAMANLVPAFIAFLPTLGKILLWLMWMLAPIAVGIAFWASWNTHYDPIFQKNNEDRRSYLYANDMTGEMVLNLLVIWVGMIVLGILSLTWVWIPALHAAYEFFHPVAG